MVIAANAPREPHARCAAVTGGPIISCANGGILAGWRGYFPITPLPKHDRAIVEVISTIRASGVHAS
jgi:hypothetical protein